MRQNAEFFVCTISGQFVSGFPAAFIKLHEIFKRYKWGDNQNYGQRKLPYKFQWHECLGNISAAVHVLCATFYLGIVINAFLHVFQYFGSKSTKNITNHMTSFKW